YRPPYCPVIAIHGEQSVIRGTGACAKKECIAINVKTSEWQLRDLYTPEHFDRPCPIPREIFLYIPYRSILIGDKDFIVIDQRRLGKFCAGDSTKVKAPPLATTQAVKTIKMVVGATDKHILSHDGDGGDKRPPRVS